MKRATVLGAPGLALPSGRLKTWIWDLDINQLQIVNLPKCKISTAYYGSR